MHILEVGFKTFLKTFNVDQVTNLMVFWGTNILCQEQKGLFYNLNDPRCQWIENNSGQDCTVAPVSGNSDTGETNIKTVMIK